RGCCRRGLLLRQPSERVHDRALAAHLSDLALAIDDPDAEVGSVLDLPARLLEELARELEVRRRDLEAAGRDPGVDHALDAELEAGANGVRLPLGEVGVAAHGR